MTNNNFNAYINDLIKTADLLKEVAPNMTLNTKNVNVDPEKEIESKIVEALNAESEHSDTVVASLDSFKLTDNGNDYLVSHPAFQDAIMGKVAKLEYSKSPNKAELLKTVLSDSIARTASFNTTLSFTGEFKEPVVEKQAAVHEHQYQKGKSGSVEVCPCGKFKFTEEHLEKNPPITEIKAEESWLGDLDETEIEIPADYPVQPLDEDQEAGDRATCGTCGLSWDDAVITGMTPAPSARCPFEAFHNSDSQHIAIKENMPRASMTDHLAQSIQAEEQVITAANDKVKDMAVNALVSMLKAQGYGTAKIAEVSMSGNKVDTMITLDDAGTIKAVSIPVEIKANQVVLPKKALVAELISKGLDLNAKLSEEFGKQVLERIAAADEKAEFEKAEAESIINEKVASLEKVAGDEPKTQFEGTNETVFMNKHLIPNGLDLETGDVVHVDGVSYKLVSKSKDQLSKGEGDASTWIFEKVTPVVK